MPHNCHAFLLSQNAMMASTAVLPYTEPQAQELARTLVTRDEEIAKLNRRITELAMTNSTAASLVHSDRGYLMTYSVTACAFSHES